MPSTAPPTNRWSQIERRSDETPCVELNASKRGWEDWTLIELRSSPLRPDEDGCVSLRRAVGRILAGSCKTLVVSLNDRADPRRYPWCSASSNYRIAQSKKRLLMEVKENRKHTQRKVWFITGAGRGMGLDF